jgi:hypothetical protein
MKGISTFGSLAVAVLVVGFLATNPADAATCPINPGGAPFIGVTTNGGDTASCLFFSNDGGADNLNGSGDPVNLLGFLYLDSTDPTAGPGLANGAVSFFDGGGNPADDSDSSGTWSINAALVSGFTNFVLGIKTGNHDPDVAAFLLGANALLGGTWIIDPVQGGGFSHGILYGVRAVPGPVAGAGVPGLVLAVGGALAWWRRRKAAVSAL